MLSMPRPPAQETKIAEIARHIRAIPDFPKPGILFRDICPLLAAPEALHDLVGIMAHAIKTSGAEKIVGLESRGFIIGIAVAQVLNLPFIPARKAGKLPGDTISVSYALEYGEQKLELQKDAITAGDKVAIVDDLLATGGTANAAAELVKKLGGNISGFFFAIELDALEGRKALGATRIDSVMHF